MKDRAIWNEVDEWGDWMVEFIPCKKGPDFSEESFIELTNRWNKKVDEEGFDVLMAVRLEPESDNNDYDFLWQQELWTKDRDKFWTDWKEIHESNWNEENESVVFCDTENILDYKAHIRGEVKFHDPLFYYQDFRFCNYKEGYDDSDLLAFEKSFNEDITKAGLEGPALSAFLQPLSDHDKDSFDLIWHNCYQDLNQKKLSSKIIDTGINEFLTFELISHTGSRFRLMDI
ncbi:hypothetical protein OAJ35_02525 [Gammaproteobacteria bacterium]|nr:hypothetical protein [Gammaproteobacteria bacterium]